MDSMENANTETLKIIRENLWNLIGRIGETLDDGTAFLRRDEKSATPAEFGANLALPLFFKINTILVNRNEEDFTGRLS
jgi:hypothetical protein